MENTNIFFPSYQLKNDRRPLISKEIYFDHLGVHFVTKMPSLGIAETPKVVLDWAQNITPPVMYIKHGEITEPDKKIGLFKTQEPHKKYYPYAMTIAELGCLGEKLPRKIKVYFCNIVSHAENFHSKHISESKGAWIEPIMRQIR